MNKALVGFVAGAAVVGAAGYGTLVYPTQKARAEVDKAIAQLPPETKARYQGVEYSLFTRTLVLTGVEMTVLDGDDSLTARVGRLSLRDLAENRVGQMEGSGLSMESGDRTTRIQADTLTGEQLEAAEGMLSSLSGVPSAISFKRLALNGVAITVAEDVVNLREIVLADYVQTDDVPRSLSLGVHGLAVEPASLPNSEDRENLAKLGYDKLSLNFDLSYSLTPETNRLSIKNAAIGGDNMGRLSFSVELGGVQAQALADPMLAMAAAQAATLESLELRYDDASLAGRVIKLAAEQAQLSESQFKANVLDELIQASAQAPATPLTQQVVDSATAFLSEPKSLSLRMKPAQPLPLWQLMMAGGGDPYAVAQATGLTVSANR